MSDELEAAFETLLPTEPAKPSGGRPRVPNRSWLACFRQLSIRYVRGRNDYEASQV